MLGHVYVVEDAKDLAQIVRDVTRYGGAYRPEVSRTARVFEGSTNGALGSTGHLRVYSATLGLEEDRKDCR